MTRATSLASRTSAFSVIHHNTLDNGSFVGRALRPTDADRVSVLVPLYHCFGMVMGHLAALPHGGAIDYPGEGFDPEATLRIVEAEQYTALHGVPPRCAPCFSLCSRGFLFPGIGPNAVH